MPEVTKHGAVTAQDTEPIAALEIATPAVVRHGAAIHEDGSVATPATDAPDTEVGETVVTLAADEEESMGDEEEELEDNNEDEDAQGEEDGEASGQTYHTKVTTPIGGSAFQPPARPARGR